MKLLERRQYYRRLKSIGTSVDTSYLVYINNDNPVSFPSKDDCYNYIRTYRNETRIFKLQIFRIETYSL